MDKQDIDITEVPDSVVLEHPVVRQLAESVGGIELPLVIPNRILMSEGEWNGHYYSSEAIANALRATDWNDKSKKSLFLDHNDNSVGALVGTVENLHMDGKHLKGDLYIWDLNTALKVAPDKGGFRVGISPRVRGLRNRNNEMKTFLYENFSIVVNPAVKTAYINNAEKGTVEEDIVGVREVDESLAQVTAMEKKRKELGMSVSEFYAVPRDPPSASKLPIFDAAHVRNALARINQVKGISEAERKTAMNKIKRAAKKFNIKVSDNKNEVNKLAEEKEITKEEETAEEGTPKEEVPAAEAEKSTKSENSKMSEIEELNSEISAIKGVLEKLEKKQESLKSSNPDQKLADLEAKLVEGMGELKSLVKGTALAKEEPVRQTVKVPETQTASVKDIEKVVSKMQENVDKEMASFIKRYADGGAYSG